MTDPISIHTIYQTPVGQTITLQAWVKTRRDSKAGLSFLQVFDGSCQQTLQVVAPSTLANYEQVVLSITSGAAIKIEGTVVESKGKGQSVEIKADSIAVIGKVHQADKYPIQPKKHTLEFLREVAHLRPRTNTIAAVMRIRHSVSRAIHDYLHQAGFYWIHTPIITSSDCEGAGDMFRVTSLDIANAPRDDSNQVDFSQDFFGSETFLTVSGQLGAEAYCSALSKVYTFGPTFRAENSNTSRHLAEFWMIEPEMAFADLNDDIKLADSLLRAVITQVLKEREDDMAFCQQHLDQGVMTRLHSLLESPLEIIDYSDAIKLLEKSQQNFEFPVVWGHDLQSEHERYLTENVFQKPIAVINYPKDIKAFYMRLNDDGKTVAAMDILVPGMGEIIGGSQREERLEVLDERLEALTPSQRQHLSWYRDLRLYGSVPHAGFGLGLERLVSYLTGVSNVRDVIPFPRTPGHAPY